MIQCTSVDVFFILLRLNGKFGRTSLLNRKLEAFQSGLHKWNSYAYVTHTESHHCMCICMSRRSEDIEHRAWSSNRQNSLTHRPMPECSQAISAGTSISRKALINLIKILLYEDSLIGYFPFPSSSPSLPPSCPRRSCTCGLFIALLLFLSTYMSVWPCDDRASWASVWVFWMRAFPLLRSFYTLLHACVSTLSIHLPLFLYLCRSLCHIFHILFHLIHVCVFYWFHSKLAQTHYTNGNSEHALDIVCARRTVPRRSRLPWRA